MKDKQERKQISVDVEFKEVKGENNVIEGYASVFDVIDSYGDVVKKGAFKKTIKERIKKGVVKFLNGHDWWTLDAILGTVTEAKEDDHGLWFKALLSAAQSVQDIKTKMLEGHINRLSIGYGTIRESYPDDDDDNKGKVGRYLEEVKLYEISAVTFPANEEAVILAVKNIIHPFKTNPVIMQDLHKFTALNDKEMIIPLPSKKIIIEPPPKPAEPELKTPLTATVEQLREIQILQIETELKLKGV